MREITLRVLHGVITPYNVVSSSPSTGDVGEGFETSRVSSDKNSRLSLLGLKFAFERTTAPKIGSIIKHAMQVARTCAIPLSNVSRPSHM